MVSLENLPPDATEDDINNFFADYDPTDVRIVEYNDGSRKGIAKVDFGSLESMRTLKLSGTRFKLLGGVLGLRRPGPAASSLPHGYSVATSRNVSGITQNALEARITRLGASIAPVVKSDTDILIASEKDVQMRTKRSMML